MKSTTIYKIEKGYLLYELISKKTLYKRWYFLHSSKVESLMLMSKIHPIFFVKLKVRIYKIESS